MESVDQGNINLIKAVGGIQPEAQKPIPLTDELRQIGVDATHVIGSTVDELISGKGINSEDRITPNKNPIRLVLERARRLKKRAWK